MTTNPFSSNVSPIPGVESIGQAFESLDKARRSISSGRLSIDAIFDVKGLEWKSLTLVDMCKILNRMDLFEKTLLTVRRKRTLPVQYEELAVKLILRNEERKRQLAAKRQSSKRAKERAFTLAQHASVAPVGIGLDKPE